MRIVLPHEARANLSRLAAQHGYTHAQLSRLIGRDSSYVGRHIRSGAPALLEEQDARLIAEFMGVDCQLFGLFDQMPARQAA